MRALAFPGEEPGDVKPPETVAKAIVTRLTAETVESDRIRVEA